MKRILALGGFLILSSVMVGCGTDTKEGLFSDTINLINQGATDTSKISASVKEAVEKAKETRKKLDLTDAMSAAKKLKETGEEANKIVKRIEKIRGTVSAEDKKANAEREKDKLNEAMTRLVKQRQELRVQLALAEALEGTIPGNPRDEVQNLRARISDSESPFEALQNK